MKFILIIFSILLFSFIIFSCGQNEEFSISNITTPLFIAMGNNGTILTSTNGTTWTSQTSGTTQELYKVKYLIILKKI